jgi:hypothetical protein
MVCVSPVNGSRTMAEHHLKGNVLAEIWLNIPQAVVLEATKDLERARGLKGRDPQLLLIKAALLLPLGTAPVKPDASVEETQLALRMLKEEMDSRTSQRSYDVFLRRVHVKIIDGVTTKGRRALNLSLVIIDPAEAACFELDGVNAVDPMTGKIICYDLVISAQELIEAKSGDPSFCGFSNAPGKPDRSSQGLIEGSLAIAGERASIGSARPAASISNRDLRSWYAQRVSELEASGEASSGEADWKAAQQQIPGRATRSRIRQVTNLLRRTGRNEADAQPKRPNKNPPEIGRRKMTAADMPNFAFGLGKTKSLRLARSTWHHP